jgi:hypothetical protein
MTGVVMPHGNSSFVRQHISIQHRILMWITLPLYYICIVLYICSYVYTYTCYIYIYNIYIYTHMFSLKYNHYKVVFLLRYFIFQGFVRFRPGGSTNMPFWPTSAKVARWWHQVPEHNDHRRVRTEKVAGKFMGTVIGEVANVANIVGISKIWVWINTY